MIKILIRQIEFGEKKISRKERAQRLSREGKELLALGAGRWFGVHWNSEEEKKRELETERNTWGKPSLIRHPEIHFNISHSGCLAACGFSRKPLGLDIQECMAADYFRIADRYYTKADREFLRSADEKEISELFYRIWVKEESYAKWRGVALPATIGKEDKEGFCQWFVPIPGYQGAVWTDKEEPLEILQVPTAPPGR